MRLFLSGCSTQSGSESLEQAALQFSSSYIPPQFKEQERIQKIRLALAESHHHYIETAANQHLPGIAYGLVVDDSLVFFGGAGVNDLESGIVVTDSWI